MGRLRKEIALDLCGIATSPGGIRAAILPPFRQISPISRMPLTEHRQQIWRLMFLFLYALTKQDWEVQFLALHSLFRSYFHCWLFLSLHCLVFHKTEADFLFYKRKLHSLVDVWPTTRVSLVSSLPRSVICLVFVFCFYFPFPCFNTSLLKCQCDINAFLMQYCVTN